jgi:hypothetical protein
VTTVGSRASKVPVWVGSVRSGALHDMRGSTFSRILREDLNLSVLEIIQGDEIEGESVVLSNHQWEILAYTSLTSRNITYSNA